MNSIFDKLTSDQIIIRIHCLDENSRARWGKMNVFQMIKHCILWNEMIQSRKNYKRVFIGRILGRIALKKVLKDDAPLRQSTPTIPSLIIKETTGDISILKSEWISGIEEYAHYDNPDFVHVFFGKMTKEQIGWFVYKHTDHHLRQFNC